MWQVVVVLNTDVLEVLRKNGLLHLLSTKLWRKDEDYFPLKFRVRIREKTTRDMKFHRFLFPFSSKCLDLNFASYVPYIYHVMRHTQWAWVTLWMEEGSLLPGRATRAHPPPRQVSLLRWRPVLSRFYSRVQRSTENTRKLRAVAIATQHNTSLSTLFYCDSSCMIYFRGDRVYEC